MVSCPSQAGFCMEGYVPLQLSGILGKKLICVDQHYHKQKDERKMFLQNDRGQIRWFGFGLVFFEKQRHIAYYIDRKLSY